METDSPKSPNMFMYDCLYYGTKRTREWAKNIIHLNPQSSGPSMTTKYTPLRMEPSEDLAVCKLCKYFLHVTSTSGVIKLCVWWHVLSPHAKKNSLLKFKRLTMGQKLMISWKTHIFRLCKRFRKWFIYKMASHGQNKYFL